MYKLWEKHCARCVVLQTFLGALCPSCVLLANFNEVHVSFNVVLVPLWLSLLCSWVIIRLFFGLVWPHLTQGINMKER